MNANEPTHARFARFYMLTTNVAFVFILNVAQQAPADNQNEPNGKTSTFITPGHRRAPYETALLGQPPHPSAESESLSI